MEPTPEEAPEDPPAEYVLRLYVTGMTARSMRAVANVRTICKDHLEGRYDLEVIDVYQQPDLAQDDQVIAAPTLIRRRPLPIRRLIGDMSSTQKVLDGLGITPTPK